MSVQIFFQGKLLGIDEFLLEARRRNAVTFCYSPR